MLTVKNEEYVQAARALGATDSAILVRHILPNILPPVIIETSLSLSFAILMEAAPHFFGSGPQPVERAAAWTASVVPEATSMI